jgi:hypothetical protein
MAEKVEACGRGYIINLLTINEFVTCLLYYLVKLRFKLKGINFLLAC